MRASPASLLAAVLFAALGGCAAPARLPVEAGMGANPQLPQPSPSIIPAVDIAPRVGWPEGAEPQTAPGFQVNAFATGLDHPRWLLVLPNGDVLVAETNRPPKKQQPSGLKAWFMKHFLRQAGAAVPSANRISLLRDSNGDGVADTRTAFLTDLFHPFGMALVGETLYIANADAVVRVPYRNGDTRITAAPEHVADLPGGPINHHWTKSLIASRDGRRLYVGVGSNSNIAENGMAHEVDRAAVLEVDPATGRTRVFASGLRNPVGIDWQPDSGELWVAVNERDELGSDVPPDYMTAIADGDFFGWPYSYHGRTVDERVQPQRPELVASAKTPDYSLGPHTASLGLSFYHDKLFPQRYRGGAFVGQHGSWNRKPKSGYKVIFVPFAGGRPAGPAEDVLAGFLSKDGQAHGRPVGVTVAADGALLVADDVGNAVWRVTPVTH
jgi:glucose/arabinose dehydrogenase